jgi:hypothetical protein
MNNHNSKGLKKSNRPMGRFRPKGQALAVWWPTGVARLKGRDGPWPATTRCGARQAHSHCSHGPRSGAADDDWPVLTTGLGWRRKLKGALGREPGKVSSRGDHPSGMPAARAELGRAVAHVDAGRRGDDPGEVLRLGGGYAVVRAVPIRKGGTDVELTEEGNGGGASAL